MATTASRATVTTIQANLSIFLAVGFSSCLLGIALVSLLFFTVGKSSGNSFVTIGSEKIVDSDLVSKVDSAQGLW